MSIQRETKIIDAKDKIVGRLATSVAQILIGKHKTNYKPNVDGGDVVIIKNADKIKFTGKKFTDKKYYRHSNQPGKLKTETAKQVFKKDPTRIIRLAVSKMLPKNKLRKKRLKRLRFE